MCTLRLTGTNGQAQTDRQTDRQTDTNRQIMSQTLRTKTHPQSPRQGDTQVLRCGSHSNIPNQRAQQDAMARPRAEDGEVEVSLHDAGKHTGTEL
jgi:hypothetical protein